MTANTPPMVDGEILTVLENLQLAARRHVLGEGEGPALDTELLGQSARALDVLCELLCDRLPAIILPVDTDIGRMVTFYRGSAQLAIDEAGRVLLDLGLGLLDLRAAEVEALFDLAAMLAQPAVATSIRRAQQQQKGGRT